MFLKVYSAPILKIINDEIYIFFNLNIYMHINFVSYGSKYLNDSDHILIITTTKLFIILLVNLHML